MSKRKRRCFRCLCNVPVGQDMPRARRRKQQFSTRCPARTRSTPRNIRHPYDTEVDRPTATNSSTHAKSKLNARAPAHTRGEMDRAATH